MNIPCPRWQQFRAFAQLDQQWQAFAQQDAAMVVTAICIVPDERHRPGSVLLTCNVSPELPHHNWHA
jgi:hypothetical protein